MSSHPPAREKDLEIAAGVAYDIGLVSDDKFVLTGSYSIDLLTGARVEHNDIDANIFTNNTPRALARVALLFKGRGNFAQTKKTEGRLEYRYTDGDRVGQFELQIVQYSDVHEHTDGSINFVLPGENPKREVIVPTVQQQVEINSNSGETYTFNVKSLPFAIATWALRISGAALNQKRQVRQTDIDHFVYLLNTPHSDEAVRIALQHHPQMPNEANPDEIIGSALSYLNHGLTNG